MLPCEPAAKGLGGAGGQGKAEGAHPRRWRRGQRCLHDSGNNKIHFLCSAFGKKKIIFVYSALSFCNYVSPMTFNKKIWGTVMHITFHQINHRYRHWQKNVESSFQAKIA